ncbi:uncharacterized protein LOC109722541 [Ananas comosus]|uniref:Uncharacterized protein LOC109722541 n=2 Tax=Ananas comosus TaxID=4615 RepID=A0A6P5GC81_ANACO|nr:uncharacterized protein LOC109722541 [Ananas comosus]CAD1823665.1 unnamed protein product [Ananas comosus var. bracteatus]
MAHFRRSTLVPLILAVLALVPAGEARRLHRVSRAFDAVGLCRQTHYAKLCQALAASTAVSSPQSLVEASVERAALKAEHAQAVAAQLSAAPGAEKVLQNVLQSCRDSYGSAADALQKALQLVRGGGRAADINSELTAAGTFVDTCQDSFDEFPDVDGSLLTNVQTNLSRLVSNSLNLAAALH